MTARRRAAAVVLSVATIVGCNGTAITEPRVERAIEPVFANLVHAQLGRMGLQAVPASALRVAASCYRVAGGSGAGEWACTVVWSGPNGVTLRDNYDVVVSANACFTATLSGAEAQLGGPVVTASDGRPTRNLVYAFDGCFDPF